MKVWSADSEWGKTKNSFPIQVHIYIKNFQSFDIKTNVFSLK